MNITVNMLVPTSKGYVQLRNLPFGFYELK